MKVKDSEAKKAWNKQNMVFVGFKLFRAVGEKSNDEDIIAFLDKQESKGATVKAALREYMAAHPYG